MKSSLVVGVSYTRRVTIDRDRTISFMGDDGRVYGTPYMVLDMEHTCRDLLMQHADSGEDSVGIEIATTHTAATPLGWTVEITATVAALDGRKVTFDLSARDELETIGKGSHSRVIVDVAKTHERLKAKQAKRPAKAG